MKFDNPIAVRATKTVYRDGDLAIKLFNEGYSKSDILNEALNQARVEETGLLVPKVLEVGIFDGRWAIVSEFVEGKTMAQLMTEQPEKKEELMSRFVDIQLSIHARRAPLLNKLKDKMERKIDETSLDATTRYELHTRLESMPKHKKVCHGDYNPSNVIITESGDAYIIDWSHATQGNASADAARTYLLFWLARGVDSAHLYMELFCRKSDTAKQYVEKWLPIVAASQSVKGKPEERELLMHWVDVVDYE